MKLFTFYAERHSWGDSFYYITIVRGKSVDGFVREFGQKFDWIYRETITTTSNLEANWPDSEIISSTEEVPDKRQLIEVVFTGFKE